MSELVPAAVLPTVSEVVQVEPGQIVDSKSWVPIQKSMPPEGGIVELTPGEYPIIKSWRRPGLLVVRAADPNDRPKVREGAGGGGHETAWSGLLLQDIDFVPGNGEVSSLPNCDYLGLKGVTIDGKKNNGVHVSNSERTHVEIENTTITRSGQGNTKHNVYIGRVPSALTVGLVSHSSKGSHAFKAIARDIEIRDSWFGTVAPDQTVTPGDGNVYVSTTLADLVSCGRTLIENVTFDRFSYAGPRGDARDTGREVLSFRGRAYPIFGSDQPPYLLEDRPLVWDAGKGGTNPPPEGEDWLGPLALLYEGGDPARWYVKFTPGPMWTPGFWDNPVPAEFRHTLRNVRFIERGKAGKSDAITDHGTRPIVVPVQFGFGYLLPQPEGWFERSTVEVNDEVTFVGEFKTHIKRIY